MMDTKSSTGLVLTADQGVILEQLVGFAMGASSCGDFATLSGYAGVGKTTVVSQLVARLSGRLNVLVSAPTNKALEVLSSKIADAGDFSAKTLHSALGLKPSKQIDGVLQFKRDPNAPCALPDYDLAIIDEASMVSQTMLKQILSSRGACKLLFVGDPFQLPPVEDDENISKAFDPAVIRVQYALTQVVRQALGNPIIAYATALRLLAQGSTAPTLEQLEAVINRSPGDDRLILVRNGGDMVIQQWAAGACANGRDMRILAYTNQAVDRHNQALHAVLHPGVYGFARGEPVMSGALHEKAWVWVNGAKCKAKLQNSEMLTIERCEIAVQPDFPEVPSFTLTFDDGRCVYVPQWRVSLQKQISQMFLQASSAKTQATLAGDRGDDKGRAAHNSVATRLSAQAYAMRDAFADVSHAYAMTVHKSQGSTFDTVLFDWQSMRYLMQHKPATAAKLLYVAATRAAQNFAVVTT